MRAETFKDVIDWTENFHQHMASRLNESAKRHPDQRAQLLLHYLAGHEKTLGMTVNRFSKESNKSILETWCYNHIDQSAIVYRDLCSTDFAMLDVDNILQRVAEEHDEIVGIYSYLNARAETPEAEELMAELHSLEEHQIMLMAQGANRLHDA